MCGTELFRDRHNKTNKRGVNIPTKRKVYTLTQ